MELSVKKIDRALTYFIDGQNYQYNPTQFMFDYDSDPDYAYMAIDAVYVIRVPKDILPQILGCDTIYPSIKRDAPLERMISTTARDKDLKDVTISGIEELDKKRIVKFKAVNGKMKKEIWINAKFFEQYFNKPITKYGVPDNITFSAITKSDKSPVIMWQDDEAIGLFLPIKHK